MELVVIEGVTARVAPYTLVIKEFAKLYESDKSPTKSNALKWFAFIRFYCHWDSPFASLLADEKIEAIADALGLDTPFYINSLMDTAIKQYELLAMDDEDKMLLAINENYGKTVEFVRSMNYKERKANGEPVFTTKHFLDALKQIEEIQKTKRQLEDSIKSNKSKNKAVGGGIVSMYEEAETKKDKENDILDLKLDDEFSGMDFDKNLEEPINYE